MASPFRKKSPHSGGTSVSSKSPSVVRNNPLPSSESKRSWEVTVNAKISMERLLEKKYTRPRAKLALLPYYKELEKFMDDYIAHVETGIVTACLVSEQLPSLRNYLGFLETYIDRFGLRFTKQQHIRLLRLAYLIMTKEGQWKEIVSQAGKVIESLIDGSRLTYRDVILDWRPVYKLYYGLKYGKLDYLEGVAVSSAVYKLKRFYAPEEIKEIWEELQIHISPRYKNGTFCDLSLRFLPVHMPGTVQKEFGAIHWWGTLWKMYSIVEMGSYWGEQLPTLFSSLTRYAPDFMDWSSLYEDIFTRILRSMGLSMRQGKVTVGDMSGSSSMTSFAAWVGDLLGGPRSCQKELNRLMQCTEVYLHPSHNGSHTGMILDFMKELADRVRERVYQERVKRHKRQVPKEYFLTDDDINQFVACMLQPALVALFNDDVDESTTACAVVRTLAALEPGVVLPRFLEHAYQALHAVCEPHRLSHTLTCLIGVVYQLAADTDTKRRKGIVENWPYEINRIRAMADRVLLTAKEKAWLEANQQLLSLRHHLIHLLEALVSAVDINDVLKTTLALQNAMLIYYLIPNVDASKCIEIHKDLNEDEKQLCLLTKKLPELAKMLLEKILKTIQSLSVCAPKNSTDLLGGLKDEQTETGDEERALQKMVDKCITVLLENSSEQISKDLVDMVFNFVTSNEFESAVATSMTTTILQETVFACPESLSRFGTFVLSKLRTLLTPEVRKQKELSSTALWYVNLASALFTTSSEAFIQHRESCFEIIELLTSCECKFANDTGNTALWASLFMLTRTYTLFDNTVKKHLRRPLNEWVPIREWAKTFQEHEMDVSWHVPDESRRKVAEEMLRRFVFPVFDKVRDDKIDIFSLRSKLNLLYSAYTGAYPCFPPPSSAKGPAINPLPSVLPSAKLGPSGIPMKYMDVPHPSGKNLREMVVELCEYVAERMVKKKREDVQALSTVATLLKAVASDTNIDSGQYKHINRQCKDVFAFINNPLDYGKRVSGHAMDAYVSALHFHCVCSEQSYPYSPFHQRVMGLLFTLSMNDYPEVRANAQTELLTLTGEFQRCRTDLVMKTAAVLSDPKVGDEQLKGALTLMLINDWASDCKDKDRLILWKAIIDMKMVELPEMTEMLDRVWSQVGSIKIPERKTILFGRLEEFCWGIWKGKEKKGPWTQLTTKEQLDEARKGKERHLEEKKKMNADLVNMLLQLMSQSKEMHHMRAKLLRTMLWRCQRKDANVATIKVLLNRIADEEEYLRDRSADELSYWLSMNKPKTNRMEWKCPQRPSNAPPLQCGIRPDNLCLVYDSTNLPNTKEKWEQTVFVTKPRGCYKWPKSISVVNSKNPMVRGPLSEAEKAIVTWFETRLNVERWIQLLLVEKRDERGLNDNTCSVIKYLLRNFESKKILTNFKEILARHFCSKERESQRLSAELFIGIAKGTKYKSFEELDALWKWLAPEVDKVFDKLNSDAEIAWTCAVTTVLSRDDPRRFHWLIERLIAGMQKPSSSSYHQAVRADLIPALKWRDTETRIRINEVVWRQLPSASIETQRDGISTSLSHVCQLIDANLFNDFSSVPQRFRLPDPDVWLARFTERMEGGEVTSSKSDTQLPTPRKTSPRKMSSSETNLSGNGNDRKMLIYLRTLLNFVVQYFDDSITCLTPGIIKLFPLLITYANEDDSEDQQMFKDADIQQYASCIIHDSMSNVLLTEKFADDLLGIAIKTFEQSCQWRVRVSVLKFLQVIVFSNIYVCERKNRVKAVTDAIFDGLVDVQNEVRQEAARCLQALTHFDFIKTNKELVQRLGSLLAKPSHRFGHGAILGYGAVVTAHPYTTPLEIIPLIDALCRISTKHVDQQMAATAALREFRRSHRDNWEKTTKTLGPKLVYLIENAIAPVYYA